MLGIIGAINEVLLDGDTQNEKYAGPIEYVTIPISINGGIRNVFYTYQ